MSNCCGGTETSKKEESCCCSTDPVVQVKIDRWLRGMAGTMILISVALAYFHSENWIWLTVFIGLNLLQSAFTKWCPAMTIFKKFFS